MSGTGGAGADDDGREVAPPTAAPCEFCAGLPAVVYCRADAARLCLPCDRHVHGANTVSSRHARAPLCAACRAAAAAFRHGGGFLCGNCDFDRRRRGGEPLQHDRGAVEGYTGCPTIAELAAALGVGGGWEKAAAAGDGWWPAPWEEPRVLRLEDVIVPTTSCHGLQPLLTTPSSSPKNRSSGGELNGEVIRQLGELARAEAVASYPEAAGGEQLPSWASSEYAIGHSGLGALGMDACHDAASMAVPSCEHEAWIAPDCDDDEPTDACKQTAEAPAPARSPAEPSLSSFVDMSEICPGISHSHGGSVDVDNNGGGGTPDPAATPSPAVPAPGKKGGYNVTYPDRSTVISRYKEKRKNRKFDKQIRYESRKARADGRLRIKGRFAKSS